MKGTGEEETEEKNSVGIWGRDPGWGSGVGSNGYGRSQRTTVCCEERETDHGRASHETAGHTHT